MNFQVKFNSYLFSILVIGVIFFLFFNWLYFESIKDDIYISTFNGLNFIFYIFLIYVFVNFNVPNKNAVLIIFFYSTFFLLINLQLFVTYSGELFEFTGSDSFFYHQVSSIISEGSVFKELLNFLRFSKYDFDDAGFIFYLSTCYKIIDNIVLIRFLNVVFTCIIYLMLTRIAMNFLPIKIARVASLIFVVSSFSLYYQSSGLKEIVMLFFICLNFFSFYEILKRNNLLMYLVLFLISLTVLLFFRTVLVPFLLISYSFYLISFSKKRYIKFSILTFVIIAAVIFFYKYLDNFQRYMNAYNAGAADAVEKSASTFNRLVAVLAGFFGPFPTFASMQTNRDTVMHASGLVFKVIISPFFLFSLYYVVKNKIAKMYPLLVFSLLHIISLSYLVHTFKIRNQFPHLPFFLICSIFGFYIFYSRRNSLILSFSLKFALLIMIGFLFTWNFLRI